MLTLKGKYNIANIFIDEIDDSTKEQIQKFLNHPAFANTYIAIMPDCHAGNGVVIGFTMKVNNYCIPNVIGVDIGCGMMSVNIGKRNINLEQFDNFIKNEIPSGFHINNKITESINLIDIEKVCDRLELELPKVLKAIGSLGGGNHFIELGKDSSDDIWITVHTGSRNFGKRIADFYQNKAKEKLQEYFIDKDKYKNLEFFVRSEVESNNYIKAMIVAQKYAQENRRHILLKIMTFLNIPLSRHQEGIESIHNYIDFNDYIIRKGATPARKEQPVIIPFNMRDGIAICKGLGNDKYNQSAPHGAGRILSRRQAKENLKVEDFQKQMKGIYTTTADANTLDEAPDAYKNKNVILDNIKETVEVIDFIVPIYNFKASEK